MKKIGMIGILAVLLVGCAKMPGMHQFDILQGNYVDASRLENVKPGMSEREVLHILGTPMIKDSFDDTVWHYVFAHYRSDGEKLEHYRIAVQFDKNRRVVSVNQEDLDS
ncbi:outer membrane protein assembly factor BamE [Ignatzschineria sp. RMDPL8A]|uniref:outer membrane protein assembly factor BamE n=1 Tax=Ignatzschineria sp. RMDPL8A TaxID=2999236 RepID=UPI0024466ECA|nr:outer membrane protein assembly factor BamE [Ignatzschineria sp. RMDPL8A]MDG9730017.1 outer membrane protein assembly factor BamE [Ignatzschineria sp. RMDPL8A]